MTRFEFRLQTLLRLRAAARDECRQQLAKAYRADQILADHCEQLQTELQETKRCARQSVAPGRVDVEQLLNTNRYELILAAQVQQVEQQRTLVASEIERRRQTLVEADRQLRILEKLRERQWAEFQECEHQREMRQLDETALQNRRVRGDVYP